MKNTLVLFTMAGLAALSLSSLTLLQDKEQTQAKKTRHIKMMKMENGKKIELDTILSGNEVFVWNGDTIKPEKDIREFSPSKFDKTHSPDGVRDPHKRVKIIRQFGDQPGEPSALEMDSDNNVEVFSEVDGDSLENTIIIHKKMRDANQQDQMIYLSDMDGDNFPPMPPMPPMPHMRMMKMKHAEGLINLNDPNIISYKKKSISGGREKIEIIRNKSDESENMNFDVEVNEPAIAPGAPKAQTFRYEFKNGDPAKKKMRKEIRVEEKNNAETEEDATPGVTK
ncbi:MAG TPA: hypothetical protein VGK10_04770 [Prolixibacteraceae bacterium]